MRRVAIVAPVRTAVGGFGGTLRPVAAEDLAAGVVKELVSRPGVDPERIEDVALAQSYANSAAPCIGRWAALHAGLPIEVPGFQTDRRCGGGLQAVIIVVCIFGAFTEPEGPAFAFAAGSFLCWLIAFLYGCVRGFGMWAYRLAAGSLSGR